MAPNSVTFFLKIVGSLASGPQTPWQLVGACEINSEEDQGLQGGLGTYPQLMSSLQLSSESSIFLEGLVFIK